MISDSFMIIGSSPSILISVPDHFPNSTRSPVLTSSGCTFPSSPPDSDDLTFHRLFLGGVGNDNPSRCLRLLLDAPHEHAIVQRSEFHKKLRKLMIQCGHLHTESGSGTSLTAKISTTRLRMRSTLGSTPFATSMTNEKLWFRPRRAETHRNRPPNLAGLAYDPTT